VLARFDPWHSALCTCPPKLTLNPYTGCDHGCVYCYASSYIFNFRNCRPKKDLIQRLKREAVRLSGEIVSISNSSDAYPNIEAERALTRQCVEILSGQKCRIQIVTKSDVVTRDIDLLRKVPSMVALTITTDDDATARIIEPHAPPPSERIKAAEKLVQSGIPVTVRIDPIIPFVNDCPERLVKKIAGLGVRHVTSSTYKIRSDNWKRFSEAMPQVSEKVRPLYFQEGEKIADYIYLPRKLRLRLIKKVRSLAEKSGIRFGTCREGFNDLNTATCDGSWVLREYVPKQGCGP
jgi:DNA repair photolyase